MGFMDQFKQTQQPNIASLISQAKQIGGNDPLAAVQQMADNGITCNLPNGNVMAVSDMLALAKGKTPQQFLKDIGL